MNHLSWLVLTQLRLDLWILTWYQIRHSGLATMDLVCYNVPVNRLYPCHSFCTILRNFEDLHVLLTTAIYLGRKPECLGRKITIVWVRPLFQCFVEINSGNFFQITLKSGSSSTWENLHRIQRFTLSYVITLCQKISDIIDDHDMLLLIMMMSKYVVFLLMILWTMVSAHI